MKDRARKAGASSRPAPVAGRAALLVASLAALAVFGLAGCKNVEIGPPSFPSCPPNCSQR